MALSRTPLQSHQHVAMRHLRGGALLPLAVHGSELAGARPPRVPRPRPGPPAQRRLVLAVLRLPVREGEGVQVTAARRSETLKVATKFTEHNIQKWHLLAASFDSLKLPKIAFTLKNYIVFHEISLPPSLDTGPGRPGRGRGGRRGPAAAAC